MGKDVSSISKGLVSGAALPPTLRKHLSSRGIDVVQWCEKMESLGAGEILLTSMDRDGTRDGFDIALTRAVVDPPHVKCVRGAAFLCHLRELLQRA